MSTEPEKPMFKTPPSQEWIEKHKDDAEPEVIGEPRAEGTKDAEGRMELLVKALTKINQHCLTENIARYDLALENIRRWSHEALQDAEEDSASRETPVAPERKEATGQMELSVQSLMDRYTEARPCYVRDTPGAHTVWLRVDGQQFSLDGYQDTLAESQWMRRMLACAIRRILQDAPEASERSGTQPAETANQNKTPSEITGELQMELLRKAREALKPFHRLAVVFDVEPYSLKYPDTLKINGTGDNASMADVVRGHCFITLGDCRRAKAVLQAIERQDAQEASERSGTLPAAPATQYSQRDMLEAWNAGRRHQQDWGFAKDDVPDFSTWIRNYTPSKTVSEHEPKRDSGSEFQKEKWVEEAVMERLIKWSNSTGLPLWDTLPCQKYVERAVKVLTEFHNTTLSAPSDRTARHPKEKELAQIAHGAADDFMLQLRQWLGYDIPGLWISRLDSTITDAITKASDSETIRQATERDTARLDWLEQWFLRNIPATTKSVFFSANGDVTLREAIDAAMGSDASEKQTDKEEKDHGE